MAFERFNELDADTQNYINAARTRARVDPSAMQAALDKYNEAIAAIDAPAQQPEQPTAPTQPEQPAAPAEPIKPDIQAPGFTLNDLKKSRWAWNVDNNVYLLDYSINGKNYMFIPEDYIARGFVSNGKQYYNQTFLNKNNLQTLFNKGIAVDLDGVNNSKGLAKTGFGTKGLVVDYDTLRDIGFLNANNIPQNGKQYNLDGSRNGGAITGLTEYEGQYVYAQPSQGDRAGATFVSGDGNRYAYYTKVRGGWLGDKLVEVAEGFAGIPLLPELISGLTGGNPLVYASLKGLQTAGAGGDLGDVIESGLKGWVAKGGLEGLDPGLNKAVQTAMVLSKADDPLLAVAELYGQEILEESGVSDAIEDAVAGVIGDDVVDVLKDNKNIVNTALDVAKGKDLSEAIVDNLTDDIIEASGAETDNEKALVAAALKGAEAADQGGDILGSAAEEYFDKGGDLGEIDADLAGDIDFGIVDAVKDGLTAAGDLIAGVADPIKDAVIEGGDILADLAEPAKDALIEAGDVIADVPVDLDPLDVAQNVSEGLAQLEDDVVAGGDVVADLAEPLKDELINLGDEIANAGSALDDLVSENLPEIDVPDVELNLPEVELNLPELDMPEVAGPELPDLPDVDLGLQKPTLDLLDFTGLLGGLRLGLTATEPKKTKPAGFIDDGQYLTQFDFLQNIEPLGTLGMLSGRNKT